MRGRWVKPEFFTDRKMAELGPVGALVYQALWVIADDTGMAMCDPELLKGQVFTRWSAVGVPEITEALRHQFSLNRIRFYQGGDELFAEVVHWRENQPIHKPSKFTYREDYSKRGKDLQEIVPEWCGTSEALVRHSPPPQHPNTPTPQHLHVADDLQNYENEFTEWWDIYPRRAGSNPRARASTMYCARRKEGVTDTDLFDGVKRYRRYCEATDRVGTEYVMQACRWLGPNEEGWTQDWTAPKRKLTKDEEEEICLRAAEA